jgi:hypothetical protein
VGGAAEASGSTRTSLMRISTRADSPFFESDIVERIYKLEMYILYIPPNT